MILVVQKNMTNLFLRKENALIYVKMIIVINWNIMVVV